MKLTRQLKMMNHLYSFKNKITNGIQLDNCNAYLTVAEHFFSFISQKTKTENNAEENKSNNNKRIQKKRKEKLQIICVMRYTSHKYNTLNMTDNVDMPEAMQQLCAIH